MGNKSYELTNHLGNVQVVIGDKRLANCSASAVDNYSADVKSATDYYPFGMPAYRRQGYLPVPNGTFGRVSGRNATSASGYRFGFNGMEKDDEVKGNNNSLDFGARIYDPRVGRWLSLDVLAREYPSVSDYSFTLNSPIQAKDADANVVIFINGLNEGKGGQAIYWGGYDSKVKNALGDERARYVDGSLGGWSNTGAKAGAGALAGSSVGWFGSLVGAAISVLNFSNVNMKVRMAAGKSQGLVDAADIYANLGEGESVKIVTHRMGTGFARGYVKGLRQWAKDNGVEFNIEYELDINAFQGGDLDAIDDIRTQSKTGGLDGGNSLIETVKGNSVPTVAPVPGAEDTSTDVDKSKGHAVNQMSTEGIPNLGNGGEAGSIEQGINNENQR